MFVYEADGSIKQIPLPSTLDVPVCNSSRVPIVPPLKENFTPLSTDVQLKPMNVNKRHYYAYLNSHMNKENLIDNTQLMINSTFQPWDSNYFLLPEGHPINELLNGCPYVFNTNNGESRLAFRREDVNNIVNCMDQYNLNKANTAYNPNQDFKITTSPSQLNY